KSVRPRFDLDWFKSLNQSLYRFNDRSDSHNLVLRTTGNIGNNSNQTTNFIDSLAIGNNNGYYPLGFVDV
ncbi:hypothetical protein PIB30_081670, partial [Stylosanthes scabra]|nr:hypothetical protein [Stylosanthes scabra]